ncbi:MAG: hypothetical protein QOI77_749 [Blastocatellia bacterium]|nr:hypothetical protein [Blastocatellia bacterium]
MIYVGAGLSLTTFLIVNAGRDEPCPYISKGEKFAAIDGTSRGANPQD